MTKIKKNCPRCNSLQNFNLRKKQNSDGKTEVYIKCSKCKWLKITKIENSSIMLEEEEIKKLKKKSLSVPQLKKVIAKKRKKIGDINRKTM